MTRVCFLRRDEYDLLYITWSVERVVGVEYRGEEAERKSADTERHVEPSVTETLKLHTHHGITTDPLNPAWSIFLKLDSPLCSRALFSVLEVEVEFLIWNTNTHLIKSWHEVNVM